MASSHLKTPPSNTITLDSKDSAYEFGGDRGASNIESKQHTHVSCLKLSVILESRREEECPRVRGMAGISGRWSGGGRCGFLLTTPDPGPPRLCTRAFGVPATLRVRVSVASCC